MTVEGRRRVAIEDVRPSVDGGAFPIKRAVGDEVAVEFDAYADGHDRIACSVLHRKDGESEWHEAAGQHVVNDSWLARFVVDSLGLHRFAIEGWVDPFGSWVHDLERRLAARQDLQLELQAGVELVERAARRAHAADAAELREFASRLREDDARAALDPALGALMRRYAARRHTTRTAEYPVQVERERAAHSAWYEVFPRSFGGLADVAERVVPYVGALGFDVLYLPPIHPIGRSHRKGPDNSETCGPRDPGSPWAIGSAEGGHDAIAPELGTLDDLHHLVRACREHGMELALDIAFQCSPDHPWVAEHPDWFRHRPDGSIRYAENPPKIYQDIYPFDFETTEWRALWGALRDVVLHWVQQGISIFRVDNPHTKPFAFWEWLIREVRRDHPDLIFLSEAFTRPKVMARLAKAGFSQSYTYFTWRNARWELEEYAAQLMRTDLVEYFRPSFWPNTPDILPFALQRAARPAFASRAVLAATLAANWGIYGPAFESMATEALGPGREEYARSEKYELKDWSLDLKQGIAPLVARLNEVRRQHPALQRDRGLTVHPTDNDRLLAYSKRAGGDTILCVVSLGHEHTESGWTALDLGALGVTDGAQFLVHDLLDGARYFWNGPRNFVRLAPGAAHIFELER